MAKKISRNTSSCSQCNAPFSSGDECVSTLFTHEEEWSRRDFCGQCYSTTKPDALASWKFTVQPSSSKKLVLSEDAIWQVIYKAIEDPSLRSQPLTFILCLMMGRKRKLRQEKSRKVSGRELQTFVNKSRKINLEVTVPMLGPAAFSNLQKEISDFFSEEG